MRHRLPLLAMLIILPGCTDPMATVFGTAGAASTIKNATNVQAFRVPPQYVGGGRVEIDLLDNDEMLSGPVAVPEDLAGELKAILLDESTYGWDFAKGCAPDYGIRVQFESAGDHVDVLFCFQCDMLTVYHNGGMAGGEDFDEARDRLAGIMKQLFPDDELIQSLESR